MKRTFLAIFTTLLLMAQGLLANLVPFSGNRPDNPGPNEVAVCCIFKNEAPWLKEWIEYHRMIGVDHFYLYDNCSTDNYIDILAPYIMSGVVELYHYPVFPFGTYHQPGLYNHAITISRGKYKWLAIIDTDEFLTPVAHNNIKELLASFEQYASLYVFWRCYGTSGVWSILPGELMIEKLLRRAPSGDDINKWGKSIVQPALTLNSESAHTVKVMPGAQTAGMPPTLMRINHYFVRTEEYLYTVKLERLRQWNTNQFTPESLLNYMPRANSKFDPIMSRFIIPLKQRLFY